MLQNYKVGSTPTQSLTLTSWLNTTNQHQRNRRPPPLATAVVGTRIWHTIVFTRTRKQGHIQRVCRSKQQGKPKQATKTPKVHAVDVDVDAYEDILATFEVHNVRKQSNDIIWVDLDVDGKPLKMELDTGSAVSIISFDLYQQKFNRLLQHKTGPSLKTYTGENIMPVGVLKVPVDYQNQREVLDLYVVKNKASLAT